MSTPEREASNILDCNRPRGPVLPDLEPDLELAATADVPVLISGDPTASLELACELYRRSGSPTSAVLLIDCRHHAAGARIAGVIHAPLGQPGERHTKVLLLLEVHALGPEAQEILEERLEVALLHRRHTGFRVIASSSAPLFDRVGDGRFRERLYYFLNMIHIVVPAAGRT